MAKRRIDIDIVANDNASSVFQSIRSGASSMASTLTSTLGSSGTAVSKFNRSLKDYNSSMYRFNRVVGSIARTAGDSIYNFAKDAINNLSELEQQHAKTMGAMATEYGKTAEAQKKFFDDSEKLKQQALTLGTVGPNGKGSLNTVTDVSYAQTALIKSGMSADDILNSNALESILKFAGGNDLSIDDATTFAVNLGTVFDKPVEQWGEMLDMVTKAADISVIDVPDIMDSLTYTGGIAAGLDRDLEEVLGIISVMGQAGLRGRVAGTGLQAFFTRILSAGELGDTAIGNAPSEYVGNMYNAFIAEAVNTDGSFKEMDEVAELLDTAMSELNDQEQAWFAKKLFGLYQMKAAYAITGAVDGDENLITDFINQITNESKGTNDIKYELMQTSQYGKLTSLSNAWEGIKTDVGDRLSPVVSAVADELFNFLKDPQNYEINWDALYSAIEESGGLISEGYGKAISDAITGIMNFGVDSAQIVEAMTPQVGGIIGGIGKLLEGDIPGAIEVFSKGIEDTNKNIEGLPEELQGTATAASNATNMLLGLAGINATAQVLELATTILKPASQALEKLFGKNITMTGKSTINATSATVNATNVQVNTSTATSIQAGTATTVNIGQVPLMNVTATVVNVYGGNSSPNSPSNTPQLPGGNLPQLPSGGTPLLPGGTGGLIPGMIAGAGATAAIGSMIPKLPGATGGQLLLPGSTTGKIIANDAIKMYKFGGTYMTSHDIISKIGKTAGKGLTLAAILGFAEMSASPGLTDTEDERVKNDSDGIDRTVSEIAYGQRSAIHGLFEQGKIQTKDNYDVYGPGSGAYYARNHPDYKENGGTKEISEIIAGEVAGRTAAREEMMSFYNSAEGIALLDDIFAAQIEENGKITEAFLTAITTWEKDGYTYTGSNEDIKAILDFMYTNFDTDYKESSTYSGRFNDSAINDFLKNNSGSIGYGEVIGNIMTGKPPATIVPSPQPIFDKYNKFFDDVSRKIQSPNINVNVTTNVDKSGNATSNVDISGISRDVSRRSSQYGQTAMIN